MPDARESLLVGSDARLAQEPGDAVDRLPVVEDRRAGVDLLGPAAVAVNQTAPGPSDPLCGAARDLAAVAHVEELVLDRRAPRVEHQDPQSSLSSEMTP